MKMLVHAAGLLLAALPLPVLAQDIEAMDHGNDGQGVNPEGEIHAEHGVEADPEIPTGEAPSVPADHAADAFYDPDVMSSARNAMTRENGGMTFSKLMIDRLEYRAARNGDGYHWEGEGWIGGDIDRLAFKTEGEGDIGGRLDRAEIQALYRHAVGPWFNLEAGVRHDVRAGPQRTYATIGIEGLAPYWFELGTQAFISDRGDLHVRLEGSYDLRVSQRLILQPAAEINIAAQDVPELGIGSGLSEVELGLRLRYEITHEFAPYVGVNWERSFGDTARFAHLQGDRASSTSLVLGTRFWF
ncbi:copper resistance protein B [Novosphingobium sp. AP12]|uniref:copper resistance protein B n=1 Tax=Novosphingobium sp. AP12 TaxID=1144305 RepID=UPI000271F1B9|nr:copper resistance protein B [Novosphingobium sp. AP12]EJL24232.1 hypothetical protein involved in copper resistance [Novosphingobium sp. AP12]